MTRPWVVDTESELPSAFQDEPEDLVDTETGVAGDDRTGTTPAPVKELVPAQPAVADRAALERSFHAAMVDVYRRAKDEAGYPANLFLRMVSDLGGLIARLSGANRIDEVRKMQNSSVRLVCKLQGFWCRFAPCAL